MFDIDSIKSLEDTQRSNFYRAKVVSLDDPVNLNKIQINIFGLTDDIPNESLPWCEMQFRDEIVTYPKVDDIIWLFFEGGDIFRPVYLGTIYAGLDITTDPGYEKFAANMDLTTESESVEISGQSINASVAFSAVVDVESYRAALRTVNNTDNDKHLIMKDTISHYDVLTKENTWSRTFGGFEPAELTPPSGWIRGVVDPKYGGCPFPAGEAVYPWYELREKDSSGWKSIYGGWTFLTEEKLKSGLASFPDNAQRTYSKRYKNWVSWMVSQCLNINIYHADAQLYAGATPKSWTFLPMSPTIYSDPELFSVSYSIDKYGTHTEEMGGYCGIIPSPFATMKLKDRKHYKQSTWLSYDGKSAIELDDNENYERLRLDFNYGEGGLEFSRAGWHGLNIWTQGSFKIQGWGRQSAGTGHATFNPCSINAIDTDLIVDSNRTLLLGGSSMANITSLGPVNIRSKMNTTSITGKAVVIQTGTGQSMGEGTTEGNAGTWFGSPVIAGNGKAGKGGMNGWMATMLNAEEEAANKYFKALNSAIWMVRKLADMLKSAVPMSAESFCAIIKGWAITANIVLKDLDAGGTLSPVSIMGANELINIEGAVKGA